MRLARLLAFVAATSSAALLAACKPERTESISLINAGLGKEADGAIELAYADYFRAATVDPENHRALFHMALVEEFDRDEPDKALGHLQQAWALAPDDRDVGYHLGRLHVVAELPDHKQAVGFLDAALALDPDYGPAHYYRALALVELERFKEADVAFREAIACDPTYGMAFRDLGLLYERFDQEDAARAVYEEGLKTAADRVDLLNNLGSLHLRAKRTADAVASFEKALAQNAARADTVFNLAFAHLEDGAPRLALQYLNDYLARADLADSEHIQAAKALADSLQLELRRQQDKAAP
jgi:tetratricopeptide (TPR) repeat protein